MADEIILAALAAVFAAEEEIPKPPPAPRRTKTLTGGGTPAAPAPPAFSSAEIGTVNAVTLAVTFDQNVTASNYATGVTIKVNGETQTITSATRQANHAIVYYVIDDIFIVNTDTVMWEYTGGNITAEDDGTALGTVTAQAVTNNEEIMKATVTLTDAQIKALPTTPIDIVPAPGAGKMNLFMIGIVEINTAAGVYTNVNPSAGIQFQLDPAGVATSITPIVAISDIMTNPLTAIDSILQDKTNQGFGDAFVSSAYAANLSIGVWVGNGGAGNFTGGNAANSMKVTVIYNVITV